MSRLNKDLVAQRVTFAKDYFKANPLKGVREMNEALTVAFPGGKMGLKQAYALEAEVKGAIGSPERDAKVKELIAGAPVQAVSEDAVKAATDAKAAVEAELAKAREAIAALTAQAAALSTEVTELRAPKAPKAKGPSLKDRITEALSTGPCNTQGLATVLASSPATVRGRLAELVKDGKVTKGEDGNFSLATAPAATPTVDAPVTAEVPASEAAPVAETPAAPQSPAPEVAVS